ncbi:MAG: poly-gamma-glutamate synthase PgsB [Acidobacteriota bacterium]
MGSIWVILGLLASLIALGVWERLRRDAARSAVPIRIHVNGTRGKSTVTRLVAGGLRAGGIRTIAKTTGTAARLILPDGSELPVRRRAPASIREQLWVLREAHRQGARALVVECMAIDPFLQQVSEREMIAATVGVITNARPDHREAMGASAAGVAVALSRTVPQGAVLVLGPEPGPWRDILGSEAARRRSVVVTASVEDVAIDALPLPPWQRQNYAVALAVTRHVGIPDHLALKGMCSSVQDPGACSTLAVRIDGRLIDLIDASAANDPESLKQLVGRLGGRDLVVFNHRADRPLRLGAFAESGVWADPQLGILITGDRPDWWSAARARRSLGRPDLPFVGLRDLAPHLRLALREAQAVRTVVLSGNAKQLDPPVLAAALGR